MKKLFLKIGIIGCLGLGFFAEGKSQIFENADQKATGIDEEIFPKSPIFNNKKTISKRSSGGATFDNNMTFGGNIPIDGGLSLFVTALFGYGINRLKRRKQQKTDV